MDDAFYEAWLHRTRGHVVLGRRLHPFCLDDVVKLSFLESPFLALKDHKNVTVEQLMLAVLTCSTTIDDFDSVTGADGIFSRFFRRRWEKKCFKSDLSVELGKFVTYIADYYSAPVAWSSEGGTALGAPWALSVAANLTRNTAMTQKEIWTGPLGRNLWISGAITEQLSQDYQIVREDELTAMRQLGYNLENN